MTIRRARPDEWQAVRALRLRALQTDPRAFGARYEDEVVEPPDAWRARMTSIPEGSMLVAEEQDALVGMCGVKREPEPGLVQLVGMWVAPEARGRGIAAALVEAAPHRARELGATRAHLWVCLEQGAAMRSYARAGFAPEGAPERGTRDPTRLFQRMARDV